MLLGGLTGLLLLLAPPVCGPIDLDAAMALSLEYSDELAIRRAEVALARSDLAIAQALRIVPNASATVIAGPTPEARGNVVNSPDSSRSLDGLGPFGRIDVQVVQPLFTWGRLDAASEAATAGVEARTDMVRDTANLVQLRVVQLYWGAALARQLLVIAAEVKKSLATAGKRITESLEKADGTVLLSDRYRIDLFRAVLEAREADAQNGLDQARIGLAAIIGLEPQTLVLKDEPLSETGGALPAEAAALAYAESQRPDLQALDSAIAARGAEVKAAEAEMLPQFFAGGFFTFGYAPNRDIQTNPWVRDDVNLLAGGVVVGFRQDLAFPMLVAKVRQARAARETLQRQRDGLARLIQVQVDGALAENAAARARHAAADAALGSGRALFRSSTLDFAGGLIEARTLIEAYGLYVESQVAAARALYDLIVARAKLYQVLGEPPRKGKSC
jgi:outer membrane protein TolC